MNNYWTVEETDETVTLPVNLAGEYETTTVTITNVIPDIANKGYTHLAIYNYGYDVEISIDGETYTFDDKNLDFIGLDHPNMWIYFPIHDSDSGKTITINYITHNNDPVGYLGYVVIGDLLSLTMIAVTACQFELVIAFAMIFSGIVVFLSCLIIERYVNANATLKYLCVAVMTVSLWIVLNSEARQFIFPNVSFARNTAFLAVGLMPISFSMYMDALQERRYHILYIIIESMCMINTIVMMVLHFANIKGLSDDFYLSAVLVVITVITVMISMIRDTYLGLGKKYITPAIGVVILGFCSILQLYFYLTDMTIIAGSAILSLGMLILMVFATADAVHKLGVLHIEHTMALDKIKDMSIGSMEAMAKTVDSKTPFTADHSTRVAAYSVALARKLKWSDEQIEDIHYSALLHDIGKIGVPDVILNKPGRLTDNEYAVIKSHTELGAEILKNITSLRSAADVALYHHERYDGLGYPKGLSGNDIPIEARLVSIADAYDAMNSKRMYRGANEKNNIQVELIKSRATQFDPFLLDTFMELYDDGTLDRISKEYALESEASSTGATELLSTFLTTVTENRFTDETDFLTGLNIRRVGEEQIAKAIEEKNGCLAFIDLDNLKKINDRFGHTSGDNAIRLIGQLLADIGTDGITCRLGGDEFLYFIPNVDREKAENKAKELVSEFDLRKQSDEVLKIAFLSAGLTLTKKGETFQAIYDRADKALYHKKENGKAGYFFYEDL
ncbi:MAG: diguanylate cyclase [Lachnospiraceae bacterium]|nr:diguanylate cyclase [Lachnospiraceae bacterium]